MLMTIGEAAEEPRQERIKGPKTTLIDIEYEDEQVPSIAAIAEDNSEPMSEITVDMNDVAAEQRLWPDFCDIIKYIEEGVLPAEDDRARKIALTADQYDIIDGILYHLHQPRKPGMAEINPVQPTTCVCPEFIEKKLRMDTMQITLTLGLTDYLLQSNKGTTGL